MFLATLAAPLPGLEHAGAVGLPLSWAEMLVVPVGGSARAQGETIAMAAVFRGFAVLAAAIAARIKDDAPPTQSVIAISEVVADVDPLPLLAEGFPPLPWGPPPDQ